MASINVGVDLGSTYTTVSIYDEDMNFVKALSLDVDNPYIPSVVAREGKKYNFGKTAKFKTGKKKIKVFKAFKMLLNETDPEKLNERGYDAIVEGLSPEEEENYNTPALITKKFLEYLLKKAMDYVNADSIKRIVIGIPEIWNEVTTYGGRTVLRDICCDFPFVEYKNVQEKTKDVQVISEPACASAFIAHKYLNPYDGKILLIDYGGGTLDITLSSVTTDASGAMEIKVLEKKGAGENVNKKVGKAGIIYMETIVERAIEQAFAQAEIEKTVEFDHEFYAAVNELEMEIVGDGKQRIEDCFEQYNLNLKKMKKAMQEFIDSGDEDDEDEWKFTTLEYHGEDIHISYALLLEVYNDIIYPTLDKQLDLIMQYMDDAGIDYKDGTKKNFKVAVVGGFGKYYPVKKQVEKKFDFSANDLRRVDMPESDAEQAISLGAALLAEGLVKLQRTSSFSFGILPKNGKKKEITYAIKYKQDIVPGEIYYTMDKDGSPYVFLLFGKIEDFVLNFGMDDSTASEITLKNSVQRKLDNIKMNNYRAAKIGFSFDESEVITMHIVPCHPITKKNDDVKDTRYVLTRFDDLFDVSKYRPIK